MLKCHLSTQECLNDGLQTLRGTAQKQEKSLRGNAKNAVLAVRGKIVLFLMGVSGSTRNQPPSPYGRTKQSHDDAVAKENKCHTEKPED